MEFYQAPNLRENFTVSPTEAPASQLY